MTFCVHSNAKMSAPTPIYPLIILPSSKIDPSVHDGMAAGHPKMYDPSKLMFNTNGECHRISEGYSRFMNALRALGLSANVQVVVKFIRYFPKNKVI